MEEQRGSGSARAAAREGEGEGEEGAGGGEEGCQYSNYGAMAGGCIGAARIQGRGCVGVGDWAGHQQQSCCPLRPVWLADGLRVASPRRRLIHPALVIDSDCGPAQLGLALTLTQ